MLVIGGGLDLVETKVIANRAYKWFFEGDFTDEKHVEEEIIVNVDVTDFEEVTSEE